jgi:chromosome segregation ATPase
MILPNLEDHRQETRTRLEEIRTRIDTLEKRAGKAEADIEVRFDQKMDQIRGQYAQAKDKLEKLGSAGRETWMNEKTELDRTIDVLSESIDIVARQLSV